ncbi:protein translocase subunit SecF [Oscillospiraceae bacterium MB08-C2-2]|nr:protein translocase subunit SecF [Oscillospiraceae bacterium MB08-C2-2]
MKRTFDFMGNRNKFFAFSGALIAITIIFVAVFGIIMDIEFKGGSILTYSYAGEIDQETFDKELSSLVGGSVSVQRSSDVVTGKETLVVSLPGSEAQTADTLLSMTESLREKFPDNDVESIATSNVDPIIGREFLYKSIVAVLFASILVIAYIALRFRKIGGWSAGVMAMIALFHDIVIVFAVFVLFRIPINNNFIAVVLTILGFSLNDTIVIYDRIRENQQLYKNKMSLSELVNLSINQSITRSVNTTLCALMGMIIVTILAFVYNVDSILSFSLPMLFGLISGAYSTICLAGPLWVMWKSKARNV